MAGKNLALEQFCDELAALRDNRPQLFLRLNFLPFDGRVGRPHADPFRGGQFYVDFSNGAEEPRIAGSIPLRRPRCVPPYRRELLFRHGLARDVTVEERLVHRVAEFDHDIVYRVGEVLLLDQAYPKVRVRHAAAALAQRHQRVVV